MLAGISSAEDGSDGTAHRGLRGPSRVRRTRRRRNPPTTNLEVQMKRVKSLLLGSAAGVVAVAGAQAADLPVKAKPVEYVKICSLYGDGFYYIPGSDTCVKIAGLTWAEVSWDHQGGNEDPAWTTS